MGVIREPSENSDTELNVAERDIQKNSEIKEKKSKKDKKDKKEKKEKKDKKEKKEKKSKKSEKKSKELAEDIDDVDSKKRTIDSVEEVVLASSQDISPISKKLKQELLDQAEEIADEIPQNLDIDSYRISDHTKSKLNEKGIKSLFPIQAATFDAIFDGKDVVGRARTGTGKTLSFALPITESLKKYNKKTKYPKVLVMCPTRELAKQVASEFQSISDTLKVLTVYGGVPFHDQERSLRSGVDAVVGTPGRIQDHLERGTLNLSQICFTVLDEADQMLDIGFADAMELILNRVRQETQAESLQTLLFSATLPQWIKQAIGKYLRKKESITFDLVKDQKLKTSENITHMAINCSWFQRAATIGDICRVYGGGSKGRTIIFTETKQEANELAVGNGNSMEGISCEVLHGDIAQKQREIVLQGFRDGKFRVLVATDVAARGLDIPEVDLVVQSNIPKSVETFVHRSGRTGRAGKKGVNIAFYKPLEEYRIKATEKKLGISFKKIGAPQQSDLMLSKTRDALGLLEKVDDKVLPLFRPIAKDMIAGQLSLENIKVESKEEYLEELVARAFSVLTGITKPIKPRSILTCRENQTTMAVKLSYEIRSPGYVRNILQKKFPNINRESWKAFRMLKDMCGCVFDIDSDKIDEILETWNDHGGNTASISLEVLESLPELQERDQPPSFQSDGRQNGGYGNKNRYNNRKNFGDGSYRNRNGYRGSYSKK